MEKTDEKLASLIEKLQEAGFALTPEIIDGAIRAIHWDGVVQLAGSSFFFVLFLLLIIMLLYGLSTENDEDGEVFVAVGCIGAVITAIITLAMSTTNNPWLRAFDPEAALYQQIVGGLF